ncbi:sialate O-acetylesterase [Asticcacaulis sp. AC402]|uniref:sialate O-acetylesterase n=1 Tax=Asticcacaulis sp. AC402 TaxID=1282361 RepID=UPI0003C4118F|nr:sialate O-acetylesterase [Asticcacaulis sp. AC402]ESQ75516.1 glycosyl hydrolase family 2 [Asticcacaulis sp. AC402]
MFLPLRAGAAALGAIACFVLPVCALAAEAPRFAGVFGDHAVLQRDAAIKVWGKAVPGSAVTVTFNGSKATATANAAGKWASQLPPAKAGGPYTLAVSDGIQTTTLADILVGDVYLCSGQSNMEFTVRYTTNAGSELNTSNDKLRFITLDRVAAITPQSELGKATPWQVVTPQTVGDASAVCYFMSKSLAKTENVPVGMIHASWGGTFIQAWMSKEGLGAVASYRPGLDALNLYASDRAAAQTQWAAATQDAWKATEDDLATKLQWIEPKFRDTDWKTIVPDVIWEGSPDPELTTFDGIVWYRTAVTVTKAQAAQAARLSLGPIDDVDITWINGVKAGTTYGWNTPRDYDLPAGTLKAGRNVIVVRVTDTGGGGGLYGKTSEKKIRFADGSTVGLPNVWRYKISGPIRPGARVAGEPWAVPNGLTTLYNAMIAPVAPYTIKGVAWYQGEANVDSPVEYQSLVTAWMNDWRQKFDNPALPFLIVQLADYGPVASRPVNSGWARLRESQRLAVKADPHAGLAISLDVGDRFDIHPTQKTVIGNRLARAAQSVVYGRSVTPSGPEPVSVARMVDDLIVTFKNTSGGLVTYSGNTALGFEACTETDCTFVSATPDGDRIILQGANRIGVIKVRYAWADSPYVNLYSQDDLPAGPFEMEISQ